MRASLNIELSAYVDKEAKKRLETENPGAPNRKAFRKVRTRGDPPLCSFEIGDVFYEPCEVRAMPWGEALKILRRSVCVLDGKADADDGADGWVKVRLTEHADGKTTKVQELTISQAAFENLLRSGELPSSA